MHSPSSGCYGRRQILLSDTVIHITNTRNAQASLGTPIDASAAMVAHRLQSYAMPSNDDNDWHVHSFMLFLHDLRGPLLRRLPSVCSLLDGWQ